MVNSKFLEASNSLAAVAPSAVSFVARYFVQTKLVCTLILKLIYTLIYKLIYKLILKFINNFMSTQWKQALMIFSARDVQYCGKDYVDRSMFSTMRLITAFIIVAPVTVQAQSSCCVAPAVVSHEQCARDASANCLTLSDRSWVNFGGEYRIRFENLDRVNFGVANAPVSESIAHRILFDSDLRITNVGRAYVQFSAAGQSGRKPAARSVDVSEPDIAQAFLDIPTEINGATLTLRLGRQELAIGNRLVGLRDGVTLKRAFDGVRLIASMGDHRVTTFYLSPVMNQPKSFDDKRTPGETFSGVNWQFPGAPAAGQWTAFLFNRERSIARFQSATGPEERQTLGIKYVREWDGWDLTSNAGVQAGKIGTTDIFAWGGALDMGWTMSHPNPLRLGIELGVASGDKHPTDGHLGTFDPLYPNLAAFADAPLYFYANQINLQANLSKVAGPLTLRAETTLLSRASTSDAIYAATGRPLARPSTGGQLSAALFGASIRWRANQHVEYYASFVHSNAFASVRAAGGRNTHFALLQMTAGF
jgi:hypothetical protein